MKMRARLAILSIVITFASIPSASAQSSAIFGVYGQCDIACRYIKINPDFTFEELLDGDLFNGQRKQGIWKYTSKTKISAQSQKPSSTLQVRESVSSDKKFSVTVIDFIGGVIAHAKISGSVDGQRFDCTTNEDGVCEIPKASSFELGWNRFNGRHTVKNPEANRFQVELAEEQMETVIDEAWMIVGNHLYVEFEGAFDKTYSLKKVPNKTAQKLFPLKSQSKP